MSRAMISCTSILRATSATDRWPSMTKVSAFSLYSSVKLRRVEPILSSPDKFGQLIHVSTKAGTLQTAPTAATRGGARPRRARPPPGGAAPAVGGGFALALGGFDFHHRPGQCRHGERELMAGSLHILQRGQAHVLADLQVIGGKPVVSLRDLQDLDRKSVV